MIITFIRFFCLLMITSNVLSQEVINHTSEKSFQIVRTSEDLIIDGVLDDKAWSQAAMIDDFLLSKPTEGTLPSEKTEIYILYDDDFLYIGGRFWDSEPDKIAATTAGHRVDRLGDDDRFAMILSTYNDLRSGYRFETNPNGTKHEGIYKTVGQHLPAWDTIWYAGSSYSKEGWVTEIAIPFKSISFHPENDTWGINFSRSIRRRGEEITWLSRNRTYNPSIVGQMIGLRGINQGIGLDVRPSITLNKKGGVTDTDLISSEPSLDIFYKFTPSLNGTLTINTDFSSTEVDTRQVNLSRFNLFFPEKRLFFLQDTDIFEFGRIGSNTNNKSIDGRGVRENGRPFFSRKIGLSSSGQPIDINQGGKLSGRVGRWSVGAIAINQSKSGNNHSSDLFIGRASASILEESSVGLITTIGDPTSNLDNSLVGFDFRFLNSRLPNGKIIEADIWAQKSTTQGISGKDNAYSFELRAPNSTGLRWAIGQKELQENFNPALGFTNRVNIRDLTADLGYTHLFESADAFTTGAYAQEIVSLDGSSHSKIYTLEQRYAKPTNDRIFIRNIITSELINKPFKIYTPSSDPDSAIIIPVGEYKFTTTRAGLGTAGYRKLVTAFAFEKGDFYNGSMKEFWSKTTWKPLKELALELTYKVTKIHLPQGNFSAKVTGLTIKSPLTNSLSLSSYIQYDNVSENLGLNARLQWIVEDGKDFFIVLNHNLQDYDKNNSFVSKMADISIKANYILRF